MNGIIGIAGVCVIIAGLLQIFNRDMAWKSAQWSNRIDGAKSERTDTWETASILQGVLAVCGGLVLLGLALSGAQFDPKQSYKPSEPPSIEVPVRNR